MAGALYHQLADILREQLRCGLFVPGEPIPSEKELRRTHSVGIGTVQRALSILRQEGLIITVRGAGWMVRPLPDRRPVTLNSRCRLVSRMPSTAERDELGVDPGVPLLEIRHPDGRLEVLPADEFEIVGWWQ
jgi:DNA-binding transcriptional MocR family regulator